MDDLRVAERGAVSTLVLNRPAKRNAITLEMWQALPALLGELASDPDLRVLVVRGAGGEAFASGADISEFERVRSDRATARHYSRVVEAACDLRFADRAATFGITASQLGIIYGLTSTRRLASIVGPSHARDILFSGRLVGVEEARAMGLVNMLCEPDALEAQTRAYARSLAELAPLSQRGAKLMLQHLLGEGEMTESDLLAFIDQAYDSEDYREGVRAFLEKRRPRFRGQ